MRQPTRIVLATAGVVALVPSLVACTADRDAAGVPALTTTTMPVTVAPTEPPVRTLAMIGDSITNGSEVELREQLAVLGIEVQAIDAEDARRITFDGTAESGLQAVTTLAAQRPPDLWVIALGTNDIAQYDGAEDYAPVIEQLVDAVPADAPLVWVDVYLESSPTASAEFNATLRAALRERGNAIVVEWAALADEDGVLRDGIHPSGYGIDKFAELVTTAVAEWTT